MCKTQQEVFDIRIYKKKLRTKYRNLRKSILPEEKKMYDDKIAANITSLAEYTMCSLVLLYVSLDDEIDTQIIIRRALADGKRVAVPYCVPNTRQIDFYFITSLDNLVESQMGILQPDHNRSEKVTNFSDSICILPGLVFDKHGYRIGYGGGYYDRFLSSQFDGIVKVASSYSICVIDKLIRGKYDVPFDVLVTEKGSFLRQM